MTRHLTRRDVIRFPAAPPPTDDEQAVIDRFDRAPAAPESFAHLTTCPATVDAPGLCSCLPAHINVGEGPR